MLLRGEWWPMGETACGARARRRTCLRSVPSLEACGLRILTQPGKDAETQFWHTIADLLSCAYNSRHHLLTVC